MVYALVLFGLQSSSFGQVSTFSVSVARPVKVACANQTPNHVTAFWLDESGSAQEIGSIFPNQIVELTTFPGHVTVFSSGGKTVSTFEASVYSNGAADGIVGSGPALDPVKPKVPICIALPPAPIVPPTPIGIGPTGTKPGAGGKGKGLTPISPPGKPKAPQGKPNSPQGKPNAPQGNPNQSSTIGDLATLLQLLLSW